MMAYNPVLCICGHPKFVHAMNMRTYQCSGRCYTGHYGPKGEWLARGCPCRQFTNAKSGVHSDV